MDNGLTWLKGKNLFYKSVAASIEGIFVRAVYVTISGLCL
jgi:hypothetical protein